MGRKANGGAKRGPKPKATKADLEASVKLLSTQLKAIKKLVRQIHAEVVPNSAEGTPEPEVAEELTLEPETIVVPANGVSTPATPIVLPVEAEIEESVSKA